MSGWEIRILEESQGFIADRAYSRCRFVLLSMYGSFAGITYQAGPKILDRLIPPSLYWRDLK